MANGEQESAPAAEEQSAETPTQQAVSPGTAVVSTATIDSLFTAIFATRANTQGTIAYQWSTTNDLQGKYTDGSMVTAHFEARPVPPTVITQ